MKRLLLSCLVVLGVSSLQAQERALVVVVPSYNNARYYDTNLESIFEQEYENYRVIYIDDASTDGTGDLVEQYIKDNNQEPRVTLIRNATNMKALHNTYHAVHSCDDDEIVLILDGDDWFAHPQVLSKINSCYDDENVWLTHGGYERVSGKNWPAYTTQTIIKNQFRRYTNMGWWALRSFYASLFKRIQQADLMLDGKFFPVACDAAYMIAMLEMAAGRNLINQEILYMYNVGTGNNDTQIHRRDFRKVMRRIRSTKPYAPLAPPYIRERKA